MQKGQPRLDSGKASPRDKSHGVKIGDFGKCF